MKKHRQYRIQLAHRINVSIAAFLVFLAFGVINPFVGLFMAAGFLFVGFGFIPLPFGILGEGAPAPPIEGKLSKEGLDQLKGEMIKEIYGQFGGEVEGKLAIQMLVDICKKAESTKKFEELMAMKPEFEAAKTRLTELAGKLEKNGAKVLKPATSFQTIMKRGLSELNKSGAIKKFINEHRKDSQLTIHPGMMDGGKLKYMRPDGNLVDNPMSDGTSIVPIGTGIPNIITQFEPGLTRVTRRKTFILQLIDVSTTVDRYISWLEQTNIDTGIAFNIAEGGSGTATYGSFRWTQNDTIVQEIVAQSKMTLVMLDDVMGAQQEAQTEILELLNLRVDANILSGTGNNNQVKGITSYAIGFQNTGLSVANPNNYDAIKAAILQVRVNGSKSGVALGGEIIGIYDPTDVVLNPVDYMQMELTKDTLGRYIKDFYPDLNGDMYIGGCRITQNIGVLQGYVLVMDAKKSHGRIRLDSNITIGYNNTDFQDGLVSMRGNVRIGHYIKSIEVNAFVYDSFTNIIAAIRAV